jgi:hypothetical protein
MIYDPDRTRDVVNRLVLLGNRLRGILILINAIQYGVLLGILGALVVGPYWIIAALVGVIAGLGIGFFLSNALAVILEWMAQLLISQQPRA